MDIRNWFKKLRQPVCGHLKIAVGFPNRARVREVCMSCGKEVEYYCQDRLKLALGQSFMRGEIPGYSAENDESAVSIQSSNNHKEKHNNENPSGITEIA